MFFLRDYENIALTSAVRGVCGGSGCRIAAIIRDLARKGGCGVPVSG